MYVYYFIDTLMVDGFTDRMVADAKKSLDVMLGSFFGKEISLKETEKLPISVIINYVLKPGPGGFLSHLVNSVHFT